LSKLSTIARGLHRGPKPERRPSSVEKVIPNRVARARAFARIDGRGWQVSGDALRVESMSLISGSRHGMGSCWRLV
jgi:hypothetical protein